MRPKKAARVLGALALFVCALFAIARTAQRAPLDSGARIGHADTDVPHAAPAPFVAPPVTASISGRVVSASGGHVANATVCLVCGACELLRANNQTRCVASDANGDYRLSNVSAGSYRMSATAIGYRPAIVNGGAAFDLPAEGRSGQDIALTPGGSALSGLVVDATGGIVPAATVRVHYGPDWMLPRKALALEAQTNDNGEFTLYVPEGKVGVLAESGGYAAAAMMIYAPARDVRLVLTPGSKITGRVLDRDRQRPVPEVLVTAQGDYWQARGTSDATGAFTIEGLRPGIYDVHASGTRWVGRASNTVTVDLGEVIKDVTVYVSPGARVIGKLRVGDAPCEAGSIHLEPAPGEPVPKLVTQTKPGGAIAFEAVPPGRYQVYMYCEGYGTKRGSILAVSNTDVLGQAWRIERGATVSVHVQTPEHRPVAGAWVQLVRDPANKPPDPAQLAPKQQRSNDEGIARFIGVHAGDYAIHGPQLPAAQNLVVAENADVHATISLRPVGKLEVIVTDAHGKANDAVGVSAEPVTPGEGRDSELGAPRGAGHYLIGPLVAGEYRVAVRDRANPTKQVGDGTPLTVRSGEVTTARVTYGGHTGQITGRVRDHAGHPVSNAWVSAAPSAQDSYRDLVRADGESRSLTSQDGTFAIDELDETGTFTVTASHSLGGRARVEDVRVGRSVELALAAPGKLSGSVRTRLGDPPPHFQISITNADAMQSLNPEFGPEAKGRWEIDDVASGEIEIAVFAPEGTRTIKRTLTPAQTLQGIDLELEAPSSLSSQLALHE